MNRHFEPVAIHEYLGSAFYDAVAPAVFPEHVVRYRGQDALHHIGFDDLHEKAFIQHFGEFLPFPDSLQQPLALRYHGHQFGVYNPEIGDGRGFLFAQFQDKQTGKILDLGTKGSGRTPYARTGDGRLTLKGALREILATEMLTALNVVTSKTVSVIETGESLHRTDEPSPARSAVLTRLLHSHIRIGSFQRLAYLRQHENIEKLLRHCVRHYYTSLNPDDSLADVIKAFLHAFADKVALMISGWMVAGFVHGVLNTDNFNITGESFDYGPWRFLPYMDPDFTAAYFDNQGRYAYSRQPEAGLWALCRLADCFLPFLRADNLTSCFSDFYIQLDHYVSQHICWRLGIRYDSAEQTKPLTEKLFRAARHSGIGWDQLFKDGYAGMFSRDSLPDIWRTHPELQDLAHIIAQFSPRQNDQNAIAYIHDTPLVSLEISVVESLWAPIAESNDFQPFYNYLNNIRNFATALRSQ